MTERVQILGRVMLLLNFLSAINNIIIHAFVYIIVLDSQLTTSYWFSYNVVPTLLSRTGSYNIGTLGTPIFFRMIQKCIQSIKK